MSKYASVMDLNKNVRDVKNQLNKMEKNKNYNKVTTRNGILKKAVANDIKKAMVKDWKNNQEKVLKRKLLEREAQKYAERKRAEREANYMKIKRELQQKPPLALKNTRKTK